MTDNINHPQHYEAAGYLVQPIDVTEGLPFCLGNAVKYLARAGKKDGSPELEDLKKALWYIRRQQKKWKTAADPYIFLDRDASAALHVLYGKDKKDYLCFDLDEETGLYMSDGGILMVAESILKRRITDLEHDLKPGKTEKESQ